MNKRSLGIVLSAALGATPIIANADCPFSGFYGGVQVGGSFVSGRESVGTSGATTVLGESGNIGTFSHRAFKRNSFAGEFFLGYGCDICDEFYLGAELFVKGARATATNSDDANGSTTISPNVAIRVLPEVTLSQDIATQTQSRLRPWEFGIDFRPGFVFCKNAMLYGRVGVAFNRMSVRTSTTYTSGLAVAAVPPISVTFPTNSLIVDNHRNLAGLRLGLGLEKALCENLTLRTDYVYTHYRRVSNSGSNQVINAVSVAGGAPIPVGSSVSSNTTSRAGSHSVMIGLSYYW